MKLIDKTAVVAEIERARNQEVQWMDRQGYTEYHQGLRDGYANIISFLDTLEVKEVDLNEEIANQYEANYEEYLTYEKFADIAKHFFELGMAVSNKQIEEKKNIDSLEEKCNTIYKDITMIDKDGNTINAKIEQREKV